MGLDVLSGLPSRLTFRRSPVCDSYVRPETLVRICDECNFGTYGGRCIICGSPGAYCVPTSLCLLTGFHV